MPRRAPTPDGPAGPVQPQDLVLTLLGTYVRPAGLVVWSGGLVALLADFGFSPGASRIALARLVRRDLLERVRDGRLVHYRLTDRAHRVLAEGDRRIFGAAAEDRDASAWTVVWHTLPEDRRLERGALGRRLRFLGFGALQDGAWVCPHDRRADVGRVLRELGVRDHAAVLLATPEQDADVRLMAARAWDMAALAERYGAFLTEFGPFGSAAARRRLDDRDAFLVRTRLVHAFRAMPAHDPALPDGFMVEPDRRARAIALFAEVDRGLAEASQRHFESTTRPINNSAPR
jgi:phenylacetic acid degradation operon negative regulatory protein